MHHEVQRGLIQLGEQIRQPGLLVGQISQVTDEGKGKSARRRVLGGARLAVACSTHAQQHAEEERSKHAVCGHCSLPFRGRDGHQPPWKTPNASLQLLPEAGAQRTLEAVSCKALISVFQGAEHVISPYMTTYIFWGYES